jgi:hypothetical protein
VNTAHKSIDDLIAQHAADLKAIYTNQTAGDHTFTGALARFASEFVKLDRSAERLERAEALHEHTFLDEYMRPTDDVSRAAYGRCHTCGNIPNGCLWCPTVIALRGE